MSSILAAENLLLHSLLTLFLSPWSESRPAVCSEVAVCATTSWPDARPDTSSDPLFEHADFEVRDDVASGLCYRVSRSGEDREWVIVENARGEEITAVAFDSRSGLEDYDTQRFFGLDADQLSQLEGKGRVESLDSLETVLASLAWLDGFIGVEFEPCIQSVLKRQSQVLSVLLHMIPGHPISTLASGGECSVAPDFDFVKCCRAHDGCYDRGGSRRDRKKCDVGLRCCIEEAGYPRLACIYYHAVRAFGWLYFGD